MHQALVPLQGNALRFSGSGLRYVAVPHTGNQAKSLEEIAAIAEIVGELLGAASWRNKENEVSQLTEQDLLIVVPYNAQVAALIEALPELKDRIGTARDGVSLQPPPLQRRNVAGESGVYFGRQSCAV